MGYIVEINSLLKLPRKNLFDIKKLKKGMTITTVKSGERIYPVHVPIEFCDEDYTYLGKLEVTKLTVEKNKTTLKCKILKVFNEGESKVFSENFITIK